MQSALAAENLKLEEFTLKMNACSRSPTSPNSARVLRTSSPAVFLMISSTSMGTVLLFCAPGPAWVQ